MLVKEQLQNSIESAVYNAMKSAMSELLNATTECVDSNGNVVKKYSIDDIVESFADKSKECAKDIATAIDEYIKSATITINTGTIITPLPGLISPTGPVSGIITLASPTTLMNSIK